MCKLRMTTSIINEDIVMMMMIDGFAACCRADLGRTGLQHGAEPRSTERSFNGHRRRPVPKRYRLGTNQYRSGTVFLPACTASRDQYSRSRIGITNLDFWRYRGTLFLPALLAVRTSNGHDSGPADSSSCSESGRHGRWSSAASDSEWICVCSVWARRSSCSP